MCQAVFLFDFIGLLSLHLAEPFVFLRGAIVLFTLEFDQVFLRVGFEDRKIELQSIPHTINTVVK